MGVHTLRCSGHHKSAPAKLGSAFRAVCVVSFCKPVFGRRYRMVLLSRSDCPYLTCCRCTELDEIAPGNWSHHETSKSAPAGCVLTGVGVAVCAGQARSGKRPGWWILVWPTAPCCRPLSDASRLLKLSIACRLDMSLADRHQSLLHSTAGPAEGSPDANDKLWEPCSPVVPIGSDRQTRVGQKLDSNLTPEEMVRS